jgi:acyl-CoA thioester hydrolase
MEEMATPARPYVHRFQVRFPEVDSYDVVWHGHYVAYLELARNALCAAAGLSPKATLLAGYKAPITRVELSLRRSARLEDELEVRVVGRPVEAGRLIMDYEIRRAGVEGRPGLLATGLTEQVVLDRNDELLLGLPAPVRELVARIQEFHRGERELPAPAIEVGRNPP